MRSIYSLYVILVLILCQFGVQAQYTVVKFTVIPGLSTSVANVGFVNVPDSESEEETEHSDTIGRVELGVFANVSKTDIVGVQVSGFSNVSACSINGLQLSGISNFNLEKVEGSQMAGISNVNMGDLNGLQMAGYSNVLKGDLKGVQISSFSNVTGNNADGTQLAGFANYTSGDVSLAQIAGFANYSGSIQGAQIAGFGNVALYESKFSQLAGFANFTEKSRGVQLAGFSNIALKQNSGVQLSGFFNYARNNKGVQLSFINYADSSSGLPIGFMSFVKNGYHVLEVNGTETFPVNVAFKTGVNRFYNIFEMGANENDIQLAYGIGTMPALGRKWHLSLDLTASAILDHNGADLDDQRYLFRFTPSLTYQPFKKLGIAIGPSLNYYLAEASIEGLPATPLSSYSFLSSVEGDYLHQLWIGGRLAIRFF